MKHVFIACLVLAAAPVIAQDVETETATLGVADVTLYLHPFLTEADLATLRVVMTNEDALKIFVPKETGYAALAVSPDDGFTKDGGLAPSAVALGELPDAETAAKEALAACNAAKKGKSDCVVVLQAGPKG